MLDKKLIDKALREYQKSLDDIINVQPMGPEVHEALKTLYESSKTEEELKKEGYEPVCEHTRLMWIKK